MKEFLSKNRDWLIELTGWLTILSGLLYYAQDFLIEFEVALGDTGYKLAAIITTLMLGVKALEAFLGTLIPSIPDTIPEANQRLAVGFEDKRVKSQRFLFHRASLMAVIASMPSIYSFMGGKPWLEWSWAVVGSVWVFAVLVVGSFLLISKK